MRGRIIGTGSWGTQGVYLIPTPTECCLFPMKAELREAGGGNSKVSLGRGWEALAEQSSNKRHLGILVAALVVAGGGLRESKCARVPSAAPWSRGKRDAAGSQSRPDPVRRGSRYSPGLLGETRYLPVSELGLAQRLSIILKPHIGRTETLRGETGPS